jgi:hypothetical protein
MKKLYTVLIICCFAVKLLAQDQPANFKTAVNKFKQFYNNNQPDSVFAMFSPEMKESLPLEQFKTTTTQLKSQLGDLSQTDLLKFSKPVAIYKASFAKAVFQLNLSLDNQDRIIGLFLARISNRQPLQYLQMLL